ncbi:MAG: hypothetical protein HYZ00_01110 [Candidatus Hydrogenedentes bacterium]|nr:hypothetical protein [Candidatus Hydrogenedentota bacterium]
MWKRALKLASPRLIIGTGGFLSVVALENVQRDFFERGVRQRTGGGGTPEYFYGNCMLIRWLKRVKGGKEVLGSGTHRSSLAI